MRSDIPVLNTTVASVAAPPTDRHYLRFCGAILSPVSDRSVPLSGHSPARCQLAHRVSQAGVSEALDVPAETGAECLTTALVGTPIPAIVLTGTEWASCIFAAMKSDELIPGVSVSRFGWYQGESKAYASCANQLSEETPPGSVRPVPFRW